MNLRTLFKDHVSSGAFKKIDGELRIVGKWGQISLTSDCFDIWIIQPDLQPLSNRKLTAMEKMLPIELGLTRLTGEGYVQTKDIALVLKTLPVLGIKRKRKLPPEAIEKLRKQLRGLHDQKI